VQGEGYGTGTQSAFLVVTNPASRGEFSGFFLQYDFAERWSLPADFRQWTNYTFEFSFKENQRLPCVLELQVADDLGGAIHFTKAYTPGAAGWDTVRATLDQFVVSLGAPFTGFFSLGRVSKLIVNVQMSQTGTVYVGSFDNIRFDGLERAPSSGVSHDLVDNFEDRPRGEGTLFAPWASYVYPGSGGPIYLSGGVHGLGSDGFQSAFLAVQSPPRTSDPGGFGLIYNFPSPWALPTDKRQWTNYVFAYDFNEARGLACQVELQAKSGPNEWIEYVRVYDPGPNGWHNIRASLDQFVTPGGVGAFDARNVRSLVLNIRMTTASEVFVGSFDNVRFLTPVSLFPAETRYGIYESANDSLRVRGLVPDGAGRLGILWSGPGTLQSAAEVTGPWSAVTGASNNMSIVPVGPRRFYRLAP
jgi:hypothetical protein